MSPATQLKTAFLTDEPAAKDELGQHSRVAKLITDEIRDAPDGRTIALLGDWGSGKSTTIKLLEEQLTALKKDTFAPHMFQYDAWSHQGDPLRRSFLDDLTNFLEDRKLIIPELAKATRDAVWNRTEITETTSDVVIRRHTKILSCLLLLFTIGLKFMDVPAKAPLYDYVTPLNLICFLLVALFPIAVIWMASINTFSKGPLRKYLFELEKTDDNFSMFSFFFEKVSGKLERKLIKTPADSIVEFKKIFKGLIEKVYAANPEVRLIIIVDNIDRIPASQAKDFWSTLQTFFGDDGGPHKKANSRYWLIAPFSLKALSYIFADDVKASSSDMPAEAKIKSQTLAATAKAYLAKTFALSLFIPPPILTNWRAYLLAQLQTGFPEHSGDARMGARDAYDFARANGLLSLTPRDLKLFVNSLVALYRVERSDNIPLPVLASFVAHRDRVLDDGKIADDLISAAEVAMLELTDWQSVFGALYYGVTIEEAKQLRLFDPIVTALRDETAAALQALESTVGFYEVLPLAVRTHLTSFASDSATIIVHSASQLSSLLGAQRPELAGVWSEIQHKITNAHNWGEFASPVAPGIKGLLGSCNPEERPSLANAIASSISAHQLPDNPDRLKAADAVGNWIEAATVIYSANSEAVLQLNGSTTITIELLQQLADSDENVLDGVTIKPSTEDVTSALVTRIIGGTFFREPRRFVRQLVAHAKSVDLSILSKAIYERLSTERVEQEVTSALALWLAIASEEPSEKSMASMRQLSIEGHLGNYLYANKEKVDVSATITLCSLIANPDNKHSGEISNSAQGDLLLAQAISAAQDQVVVELASLSTAYDLSETLFQATIKSSVTRKIGVTTVMQIIRLGHDLTLPPSTVEGNYEIISKQGDLASFLSGLKNLSELIEHTIQQPFEVEKVPFYLALLKAGTESDDDAFSSFLRQSLAGLSKAEWQALINAKSNPAGDVLTLSHELRNGDASFSLGINLRAALRELANNSAGQTVNDAALNARLVAALAILDVAQNEAFASDVFDDLINDGAAAKSKRIIEILGDTLVDHQIGSQLADRFVRRVVTPVLLEPTSGTLTWLAEMWTRGRISTDQLSTDGKKEMEAALRAALRPDTSPELKEGVGRLADAAKIDIQPPLETAPVADDSAAPVP